MNIPVTTAETVRIGEGHPHGALVQGDDRWAGKTGRSVHDADKRTTMPKGRYVYGKSNPRLRPNVVQSA